MNKYLEDWQLEELSNLDDIDIDMVVQVLEYKIFSLKIKDPIRESFIELWQIFRKINTFEEVKFH